MSEYRFRIDAFSIDTIPMARLAEYMAGFARLLGEQEHVHFKEMEPGSAVLVSRIEEPAVPKVMECLQRVREGRAPRDAMEAFKSLDTLLARDNSVGTLIPPESAEIIAFPGRTRPKPMQYGPFRERGLSQTRSRRRLPGVDHTACMAPPFSEAPYDPVRHRRQA